MKNKKTMFASIALISTLTFSNVIPATVFANETATEQQEQIQEVVKKQVNYTLHQHPEAVIPETNLHYFSSYFKDAVVYEENGQHYAEVTFSGVMTMVTPFQVITKNGEKIDAETVYDNGEQGFNRVYTKKFPLTNGNLLDLYFKAGSTEYTLRVVLEKEFPEVEQVNYTLQAYPGQQMAEFLINYLGPYFGKLATVYKENGQYFAEITFTEKMYIAKVLQAHTANDGRVDAEIVYDNGKSGMERVYTAKFPLLPGNLLDLYIDADTYGKYNLRLQLEKDTPEITDSIAASTVTVTNNYGENDVISFENLIKGATYKIYKAYNHELIDTFTASSSTANRSLSALYGVAGSVYVTVIEDGKAESGATKVSYKAEKLPSVSPENFKITNNSGADDKIEFTSLTNGLKYTVYSDADLKTELVSFTANGTTHTTTVPQIGVTAGEVYVVVSRTGYQSSGATKVSYKAEKLSALAVKNVTITNSFGTNDKISFKGLTKGNTYTVYSDSALKNKLISFTANDTSYTATVKLNSAKSGAVYIVASKDGYQSSEAAKVSYKAEKLPALAVKNITITNSFGTNDKISFKGLTKGNTYTVYSDSALKNKLTSFTAKSTTYTATVKLINAKAGNVYIVASKDGYQSSEATKVSYKAEKLPALSATKVTIKNNIKNDQVEFKGLTKGNTYTVYSDAKLKKKLFNFTASKTTYTKTLNQIGGKAGSVYVVASKSGYTTSTATKVSYKAEPTPSISAKNVKITNNKKGKDTIELKGLKKGTTYVIYKDAKKKTKLASFKAIKSTQTVKVNLSTKAGNVYITSQAPDYSVSTVTSVSYKKAN